MFGVNGVPYMSPDQYNQMLQSGMNQQFNNMYGNMQNQNQNMNQNRTQNMMQILKGRPVSSAEEARASMIDMDGSLFVFPDIANNCIHTKQIMLDGTADFKTYVMVEQPKQNITQKTEPEESPYVLKNDFENIINSLIKKIKTLEDKKDVTSFSDDGEADGTE